MSKKGNHYGVDLKSCTVLPLWNVFLKGGSLYKDILTLVV